MVYLCVLLLGFIMLAIILWFDSFDFVLILVVAVVVWFSDFSLWFCWFWVVYGFVCLGDSIRFVGFGVLGGFPSILRFLVYLGVCFCL